MWVGVGVGVGGGSAARSRGIISRMVRDGLVNGSIIIIIVHRLGRPTNYSGEQRGAEYSYNGSGSSLHEPTRVMIRQDAKLCSV